MPGIAAAVDIPKPIGYVNDFADVLSSDGKAEITAIAQSLAENQGVELAVVTVRNTEPDTAKMFATNLFNEWGIGGPEDSGLLILMVTEAREIEVETGYGLEGTLPDGKVGAILDQFVIPHLARNDYDTGLVEAAKAYQAELLGESFRLETKDEKESEFDRTALIIFLVLIVIIMAQSRKKPPNQPRGGSGSTGGKSPEVIVYPTRIPINTPKIGGGKLGGGGSSGRSGGFGGFSGGRSGGGGAGRKF